MDRRKLLLVLCFLWVLVAIGGGLWRLVELGKLTAPAGPQALARDGQGGLFLATDQELLRLDGEGNVRERRSAAALGLADLNALATGEGSTLFLYESTGRRVHRCDTASWTCAPFGPAGLGLDSNVQMAWLYGSDRRLLLSDNTHHRLLALDANGAQLALPGARWDFPNQISTEGGAALLAESDHYRIVELDPVANTRTAIALATRERPYRFVRRDQRWWVVEAGVTLERAEVRHYIGSEGATLATGLKDATTIVDTGRLIVVAGREDWRLAALDPDTGVARDFGSAALRQEFRDRHQAMTDARKERSRLPAFMLLLMAPGLIAGLLLQRAIDRDREAADPQAATGDGTPSPARPVMAAFTATAPSGRKVARIETDRAALAAARALQNRQLVRLALIMVPLLLLTAAVVLWMSPPRWRDAMLPLLAGLTAIPVLLYLLVFLTRRQQDRLYDQQLLCGPDKVVHVVAGKPVRAVRYEDIWLGEDSLVLGARRLPLYTGYGPQRSAFWQLGELHRELGPRIPHEQHLGEVALGRALVARGRVAGLSVLAGRFAIAIAVVTLILVKLASLLPVNALGKLLSFLN
jgi:hypothetical protein